MLTPPVYLGGVIAVLVALRTRNRLFLTMAAIGQELALHPASPPATPEPAAEPAAVGPA